MLPFKMTSVNSFLSSSSSNAQPEASLDSMHGMEHIPNHHRQIVPKLQPNSLHDLCLSTKLENCINFHAETSVNREKV
jgi:hypothetical protein